jgi:hypothetical protein
MTSEPMLLDPEVEELLRDVAADPDSALLRVRRGSAVRTLFEELQVAGPATAGLSLAERELVRIHRLELAWLFRQLCFVKLLNGARSRAFVSRYITPDRAGVLLDPASLGSSIEGISNALDPNEHGYSTLMLAACSAQRSADGPPTILELGAAAHRLHPTAESRILASQHLVLGESPLGALSLLRVVLQMHPIGTARTSAWHTIGLAYSRMGRLDRSHGAYVTASSGDQERPGPWLDRVALAFQLGAASDVLEAASHLEELIPSDHEEVDWYVTSRTERRRAGDWHPTPAALALARELQDQLGAVGRRISHVFT